MEITENPTIPKYDPMKKYKWEPNTTFILKGNEFGIILNSLRTILSTKEAQAILMANKASEAIENVLASAVQSGVVKEDK